MSSKKVTPFILCLALFGALIVTPINVSAQTDKSCTTNAECAGPEGVCVPSPLGENSGNKNCRNLLCSASSVRIVNAAGAATGSTILKPGQFVEITSSSVYDVNSFVSAFFNDDNQFPPGAGNPTDNPKIITVSKAHLDKFNNSSMLQNPDGSYVLTYGESENSKGHVMKVPYAFFNTPDLTAGANGEVATKIQINSYFGMANPFRYSLPEAQCVTHFTFEPTSVTTTPANTSCPAASSCSVNKTCSCNAGYNNCDNNWTNGCETAGKCSGGGVCTVGSQCASGVCTDHICQGGGAAVPTKIPSGGQCTESSQCSNGYSCTSGKCMPNYCDAVHTCPADYSCKQGVCFPGTCDANHPCVNGYSCSTTGTTAGKCIPPVCRADAPCPVGYTCQANGTCLKDNGNGSCTNDAACKTNGQCINNSCFCKTGTYNCDRNWANGCESTTACAGSGTAQLNIKVKFNGIGANIPPVKDTQKVKVILANKYLTAPVSEEAEFTISGESAQNIRIFEGTVDFTNIPFGQDYSVFIKGAQQIQKRICDNQPTESVDGRYYCTLGKIKLVEGTNTLDFSNIYQLGGDIPVSDEQSGFVDSVDITYIRSNLGSKDETVVSTGDLNFDGIVDTQDYAIALYSLSFKYDEEVIGNE